MTLPPFDSPAVVPVFPLPQTVFFPTTSLPLHVFEPRYREMVADASDGAGLIAVALLRPGFEADYQGAPAFHPIGTVGAIEECVKLDDGRYAIRLQGVARVAFKGVGSEKPYQLARAEPIVETVIGDSATLERTKLDLMATHGMLMGQLAASPTEAIVFDDRMPFAAAVNAVCATVPVEAELRQKLLEIGNLSERGRQALLLLEQVLERVVRLNGIRDTPNTEDELN